MTKVIKDKILNILKSNEMSALVETIMLTTTITVNT